MGHFPMQIQTALQVENKGHDNEQERLWFADQNHLDRMLAALMR